MRFNATGERSMDSTNRIAAIIIALIVAFVLVIAAVLIWVDPPGKVPGATTAPTTPTTPQTP